MSDDQLEPYLSLLGKEKPPARKPPGVPPRPPENTPNGTKCILRMLSIEVVAIWNAGTWDWPQQDPKTKKSRYTPEELAPNHWEFVKEVS